MVEWLNGCSEADAMGRLMKILNLKILNIEYWILNIQYSTLNTQY